MKPFNLEKAIAGEPIMSRDGAKAKFITYIEDAVEPYKVIVLVDGLIEIVTTKGKYIEDQESEIDILMAPQKRTVWFNIYKKGDANYYESEEEANQWGGIERIGGKPWPFEIEE